MEPNQQEVYEFHEAVWRYYDQYGRTLPWREVVSGGHIDPYKVMVSEIMLQQTQVNRVIPKYVAFLEKFPSIGALAAAELGDVLIVWSGLGYNRRAKFLWQAARMVNEVYGGVMPRSAEDLQKLPGIGRNTAAAIAVYAYDSREVFIETNIRTVFIHHFFADRNDIHDKEIMELVRLTLPEKNFREWYWAIMDYGTHLKSTVGNLSRASKHYTKQSKFQGSLRQIRGAVLRHVASGPKTFDELQFVISDSRLQQVLDALVAEQMITCTDRSYRL
jgi:A/G-specific adenine glycosylase